MADDDHPATGHLRTLAGELAARELKCELITTGCVPRLWLELPWLGGFSDSAFEDHILASDQPDKVWRYWWAWIEPIAPTGDPAAVAATVIDMTIGTPGTDSGGGD
jgi:hypothetical protein